MRLTRGFSLAGGGLLILLVVTCPVDAQPSWSQLSPSGTPPQARQGPTGIYDQSSNRMTIFGGGGAGLLNDVWVLTNADGTASQSWVQLSPAGELPGPRNGDTAVSDPNTNSMIIFGGSINFNPGSNDVWVLSNANGLGGTASWIQLAPVGGPPNPRLDHTAVYDWMNNRMIVYGGATIGGPSVGDVWVLSNANGLGGTPTWTQLFPAGATPGTRQFHVAVYDSTTNQMVVFGGQSCAGACTYLNDVWVLSDANGLGGAPTWTQLSPLGTPPSARWGGQAVHDEAKNQMIIHGGNTGSGSLSDVWVLSVANGAGISTWTQLSPGGGPAIARDLFAAIYNPLNGRLTVFGGRNCTPTLCQYLNDTWVLSLQSDTTPPVLSLPATIRRDAVSPAGVSVTYSVTATDNVTPSPTVTCMPSSGSTFPIGVSTVSCAATDLAGNTAHGSFLVIVNGAQTQVQNLPGLIESFNLTQGITNSLDAKLAAAQAALTAAKTNDMITACNQMGAFINATQAQSGSQLTVGEASQLLASASQIKAVLSCP